MAIDLQWHSGLSRSALLGLLVQQTHLQAATSCLTNCSNRLSCIESSRELLDLIVSSVDKLTQYV